MSTNKPQNPPKTNPAKGKGKKTKHNSVWCPKAGCYCDSAGVNDISDS